MFFEELVYIMTRPQQEEKSTDEDWLIRYMQTCELWIRFSVVNYTEKNSGVGIIIIIHISIPPSVVTSEAMVAQVTLLLFDMIQIKKVSLKPGFENTVIDGFRVLFLKVSSKRQELSITETASGEVNFGERLTQQTSVR